MLGRVSDQALTVSIPAFAPPKAAALCMPNQKLRPDLLVDDGLIIKAENLATAQKLYILESEQRHLRQILLELARPWGPDEELRPGLNLGRSLLWPPLPLLQLAQQQHSRRLRAQPLAGLQTLLRYHTGIWTPRV